MVLTLFNALQCDSGRCIALTGSGGKTTIMFQLGRELLVQGKRVIISTTAKMATPAGKIGENWFLLENGMERFKERWRQSGGNSILSIVASRLVEEGNKLDAINPETVRELISWNDLDYLLLEADGSRGRAIKGYAPYEPVIPDCCDIVLAVAGLDILGRPLSPEYVHRHEIVMKLLEKSEGAIVDEHDIAALLIHQEGYLGRIGHRETRIILNSISHESHYRAAIFIAKVLRERSKELKVCLRGPLFGLSPENSYGHIMLK